MEIYSSVKSWISRRKNWALRKTMIKTQENSSFPISKRSSFNLKLETGLLNYYFCLPSKWLWPIIKILLCSWNIRMNFLSKFSNCIKKIYQKSKQEAFSICYRPCWWSFRFIMEVWFHLFPTKIYWILFLKLWSVFRDQNSMKYMDLSMIFNTKEFLQRQRRSMRPLTLLKEEKTTISLKESLKMPLLSSLTLISDANQTQTMTL